MDFNEKKMNYCIVLTEGGSSIKNLWISLFTSTGIVVQVEIITSKIDIIMAF